jgi:hypothetical protein
MFTRQFTKRLKATCSAELARKIESEILPLVRQQNGFPHEVVCLAAVAAGRIVIEGLPKVTTFELSETLAKAA